MYRVGDKECMTGKLETTSERDIKGATYTCTICESVNIFRSFEDKFCGAE